MRILHVITSLDNGGAQSVLYNLILNENVCTHGVVCLTGPGKYTEAMQAEGIFLVHLNMSRGRFRISAFFELLLLIKRYRPDVMQTWMYHSDFMGGLAAWFCGVRTIVWGIHHSTLDKKGTSFSTRLVVSVLRLMSWFVPDSIISCSERALDLHVSIGYREKIMHFVANGYDLTRFHPGVGRLTSLSCCNSVPSDCFIFLNVGRWNPQKDHRNFISAARLLRDNDVGSFVCLLVGPNIESSNSELKEILDEYDIWDTVYLCGESDEIHAVYQSAGCHVLSSSFGEAYPNVVAESMSCGVPNIVTDVGDAREMVGNCGWVVEPKDPVALCAAMEKVLKKSKNRDEYSALSNSTRQRAVEKFNVVGMVDRYREIWEKF